MSDYTNFHGYSHGSMRDMVQSMDSGAIMAASDPWRKAAETLKQIRTSLNTASADATSSWEGSTSNAFYSRMVDLSNTANNVAAYANDAAMTLQMMSEAIDTAKRNMPEEPDFWDKAGDAISDTAKGAFGSDDEDTQTGIADERKAQAVAVMQTLASQYRSATSYLKPPPPIKPPRDDVTEIPPSGNPSGVEAIGALIMGGGLGGVGGSSGGSTSTISRSSSPSVGSTPKSPKPTTPPPTDPGIKGGTANPAPRPKGPATGIDGIHGGTTLIGTPTTGVPGGGGAGQSTHGGSGGSTGPSGPGGGITTKSGGSGGLKGGSNNVVGAGRGGSGTTGAGSGRGGSAFGAGGMGGGHGGGGAGAGGGAGKGGAAGRSGSSLVRKGGGVVGDAARGTGGRAFTEGGSGIGRGRGQGGQGAGGQGHGMPGNSQAGKKDKKKGNERPDYLVEDEETWASGEQSNPNVVE